MNELVQLRNRRRALSASADSVSPRPAIGAAVAVRPLVPILAICIPIVSAAMRLIINSTVPARVPPPHQLVRRPTVGSSGSARRVRLWHLSAPVIAALGRNQRILSIVIWLPQRLSYVRVGIYPYIPEQFKSAHVSLFSCAFF